MRQIEKILSEIESCIQKGTFKKLEHDKLDLKDNSHYTSDWNEVHKNLMEKRSILIRVSGKPFYSINKKFKKRPSIYEDLDQ